jgi:hypothetical protein
MVLPGFDQRIDQALRQRLTFHSVRNPSRKLIDEEKIQHDKVIRPTDLPKDFFKNLLPHPSLPLRSRRRYIGLKAYFIRLQDPVRSAKIQPRGQRSPQVIKSNDRNGEEEKEEKKQNDAHRNFP